MDELFSRERTQLELSGISGMVAKGHLVVFELDQAAVADCHAKDIGSQAFQSCTPIAHRFALHHPILLPDLQGYSSKPDCFDQSLAELTAEDLRECLHGQ